ncbi:iron-sulfur cluster assembly scaffold protein NifU [Agromyces rhizosphaerae]|uniref:Iron-sulfur cluster assembly scaffold protein NifU n=1 Tax=Agromyces rhizosphaerae TaxID=88374 RepID=A0A9W6CP81_9MICO|nr:SUF system NifU family Fe-S cluster assembly protein [Agromyces rhizosphaerae]GLI26246.1 iron-sulfur cluster assembly scaffold protein NifU [Agromyces rhizosphaerae]
MSGLDQLYQQIILDHSKRPHGVGLVDGEETSHQLNTTCGDEVTLALRRDGDGRVVAVGWEGQGCSISQASASMLSALLEEEQEGMTDAELTAFIEEFRTVLRSRGTLELDEERFGDAAALGGASRYVARVKCAMLPWVAAEDLVQRHAARG